MNNAYYVLNLVNRLRLEHGLERITHLVCTPTVRECLIQSLNIEGLSVDRLRQDRTPLQINGENVYLSILETFTLAAFVHEYGA